MVKSSSFTYIAKFIISLFLLCGIDSLVPGLSFKVNKVKNKK